MSCSLWSCKLPKKHQELHCPVVIYTFKIMSVSWFFFMLLEFFKQKLLASCPNESHVANITFKNAYDLNYAFSLASWGIHFNFLCSMKSNSYWSKKAIMILSSKSTMKTILSLLQVFLLAKNSMSLYIAKYKIYRRTRPSSLTCSHHCEENQSITHSLSIAITCRF